jgi:polysaccharide biosynthesis protein PslH
MERRATRVTAVTSEDAKSMREWGVQNVALVPNGVDTDFYASANEVADEKEILSVASLDWFPNADALEYFAQEIFPLIREKLPKAVFRIVGRRPPASLKEKLSQVAGIDFVGEVDDVRPYLERAAVVVVPLRIGGGSRLKILEAMAARKAIVSTSIGAEGLELISGEHLYIADSPNDFAQRVLELARSSEARQKLGASGKKQVTERYGWDGIASHLETTWFDALQKSEKTDPVRVVHREVGEAL